MTAVRAAAADTLASPNDARVPGELGVWVFILGDLAVFSFLFIVFLLDRRNDAAGFAAQHQQLDAWLGMFNTVLMLCSSWCVATAVQEARCMRSAVASRLFLAALVCGAGFVVVKYFEWSAKISAGYTLSSHDFFMYYYMLTGIHLLHVLIGMGVLVFLARHAALGAPSAATLRNLESGACFWHVVDLLWIVLFALLYLLV